MKNIFKIIRHKIGFNRFIKQNPELMVCPTCLSNCGQCGGSGHFIKLKDLKNHPSFKQGWTKLIAKALLK